MQATIQLLETRIFNLNQQRMAGKVGGPKFIVFKTLQRYASQYQLGCPFILYTSDSFVEDKKDKR